MDRRELSKDALTLAVLAVGFLLIFVARSAWAQFPVFSTPVEVTDSAQSHRTGHLHHLMTPMVLTGDKVVFSYWDYTENAADPNIHANHEANGFIWVRTYDRITDTFSSAIKISAVASNYNSNHENPYLTRDGTGTVIATGNLENDNPGTDIETVNSFYEDPAASGDNVVDPNDVGPWSGMVWHRRLPDPEDSSTYDTEGPMRIRFEHSWGREGTQTPCEQAQSCLGVDNPYDCCDGAGSGPTCSFNAGACGLRMRDAQGAYDPSSGIGYMSGTGLGSSFRVSTKRLCSDGRNRNSVCTGDSGCETICLAAGDPLACCTGLNTGCSPGLENFHCDAGLDGRSLGEGQPATFYRFPGDSSDPNNVDGPYFPFVGMQNYPAGPRPDMCSGVTTGAESMDTKRSIAVRPFTPAPGGTSRIWMAVSYRNNATCNGTAYEVFNDLRLAYSDDGGLNWSSSDGTQTLDPNQSASWDDTDGWRVVTGDFDAYAPSRIEVGVDGSVYFAVSRWDGVTGSTIGDPNEGPRDYFNNYIPGDSTFETVLYKCGVGNANCVQKGDVALTSTTAQFGLVRPHPLPAANGDMYIFGENSDFRYYQLLAGNTAWETPVSDPVAPGDDDGGNCDDFFWRPLMTRDYWDPNLWHVLAEQPCDSASNRSRIWYFTITTGNDTRHVRAIHGGGVPF